MKDVFGKQGTILYAPQAGFLSGQFPCQNACKGLAITDILARIFPLSYQ